MPLHEENVFTKILTSTDDRAGTTGIRRQESWFKGRSNSVKNGNELIDCPSCKGSGVRESADDELVALIPYSDERLRPRCVKLRIMLAKIGLALFICAVLVGFLLLVFLPTGHVAVQAETLTIIEADITGPGNPQLSTICIDLDVKYMNHNILVPVYVTQVNVTVRASWRDDDAKAVVGTIFQNKTVYTGANNNATQVLHINTTGYDYQVIHRCCCRQYTCCNNLWYKIYLVAEYELQVAGIKYFSSFTSQTSWHYDDCKYTNHGFPWPQNASNPIHCEVYGGA